MEAQHEDFWKKFHANVQQQHRTRLISGAVMAPMLLLLPFVFLWLLGTLTGR